MLFCSLFVIYKIEMLDVDVIRKTRDGDKNLKQAEEVGMKGFSVKGRPLFHIL